MPELATHVLAACPLKLKIKKPISPLLVGAILPDVLSRIPTIVFPDSYSVYWMGKALHAPLTLFLACLLLPFLFEEKGRKRVFKLLVLGVFSHLLLDSFQKTLVGGYLWFFPINFKSFSLNFFWSDESLAVIPFLIAANLILFRLVSLKRESRAQAPSSK